MKKSKRALQKRRLISLYQETSNVWEEYHQNLPEDAFCKTEHKEVFEDLYSTIIEAHPIYQLDILHKVFQRGYQFGRRGYRLMPID